MGEVLRTLWLGWKAIARTIGHFQTRVILSVLYFVLLLPVALGLRALADPLNTREVSEGARWRPRKYPLLTLQEARRQ